MTSKASQATSTSAITIVEKEFPAVKNVRKWDARGALLGHPGPSPPFDVSSVKSTPSGEATQRQDETSAETSTVIPGGEQRILQREMVPAGGHRSSQRVVRRGCCSNCQGRVWNHCKIKLSSYGGRNWSVLA